MPPESSNPDHVRDVYEMIVGGHSRINIDQFCRERWDEDSEPLILSAFDHLKTEASTKYEIQMGWCIESMKELYRKSVEIGDFASATKCVKEVAELARRMKIFNKES